MAKKHKTHRFSQVALDVIQHHQQRTGIANFSEALEDIIIRFGMTENNIKSRFKRFLAGDPNTKPLEAFNATAE